MGYIFVKLPPTRLISLTIALHITWSSNKNRVPKTLEIFLAFCKNALTAISHFLNLEVIYWT